MKQLSEQIPSVAYACRGELIRFTRKKMGLSQKYVAAKVRMSQSALSKIEAGVNKLPGKIIELSELLHLDPKDIMSIDNKKDYNNLSDSSFLNNIESVLPNWKDILIEAIRKA